MYQRQRYDITRQRALRMDASDSHLQGTSHQGQPNSRRIATIDSLPGSEGNRRIFGMLTRMADGHVHLEDPFASVPLDLSKAV